MIFFSTRVQINKKVSPSSTGWPKTRLRWSPRDPDGGNLTRPSRLTPGHEPGRNPELRTTLEDPQRFCTSHRPGSAQPRSTTFPTSRQSGK